MDVQNEYECKVHSLVTDNAENMSKLRTLVTSDSPDIIAYGCGAHLLNLLAKDLNPADIMKKVRFYTHTQMEDFFFFGSLGIF